MFRRPCLLLSCLCLCLHLWGPSFTPSPRPRSRTAWEVLDLPRGSDARAIRQRYRELVAREHPDKRPDLADADARFAEITAAYRELMDGPKGPSEEFYGEMRVDMEEMVVDERDNDSLVVLLFIFIWFLIFGALAVGQDGLSWEDCRRNWEWWCSLKGA
ncbi:unnamed protein product [Cladocopium goreaui]|uniref:DnaJ homolog subfamily C member 5B (Cysteine string protein beta) (CSP-beta) n=1 Tax=Cladocopium goreaui TaxID=2562237 RepID=A0A9P1D2S1_9DINO|nr:unnamed protein product [Cladocopium goreaui]